MNKDLWSKQETVRLLKGAPGTQYQEADDTQKSIIRDWVRSLLQKSAITVSFIKADGTVRDMNCTLDWDQIPADKQPQDVSVEKLLETKKRKQPDEHSLRVFDLDKQEWRSFRFDRLKKVSATLEFQ